MVTSESCSNSLSAHTSQRMELEHVLEAPDRNFIGHRDIFNRSVARYEFIAPYVNGSLLEIGCGRGYGFENLDSHKIQIGVDISIDFLFEATKLAVNASFIQANGTRLPFPKESFNTIIAFEIIEHLRNDRDFLNELIRVSSTDAIFLISTPNRYKVSGYSEEPVNPFHYREYSAEEFTGLLQESFSSVEMFGQVDRPKRRKFINTVIDAIPPKVKNLFPIDVQSRISVTLRPPLSVEDCIFEATNLDQAHTFLAICKI